MRYPAAAITENIVSSDEFRSQYAMLRLIFISTVSPLLSESSFFQVLWSVLSSRSLMMELLLVFTQYGAAVHPSST